MERQQTGSELFVRSECFDYLELKLEKIGFFCYFQQRTGSQRRLDVHNQGRFLKILQKTLRGSPSSGKLEESADYLQKYAQLLRTKLLRVQVILCVPFGILALIVGPVSHSFLLLYCAFLLLKDIELILSGNCLGWNFYLFYFFHLL